MSATSQPHVLIIPTTAEPSTAPPANPWYLALKRVWLQLLPVLPILIDVLIGLYQSGEITPPSKWAAAVSTLVIIYQAVQKGLKEQHREDQARTLAQAGLPVGTPLRSEDVTLALNTRSTLLEAQTTQTPKLG